MISGNSMLTFSDFGQKELHLKQGTVSANVNPQTPDKPMLVYTDSARLEVLGTQFKVEADLASTSLNVNEGQVRVRRLSDGRTVDVPARHRVVAAAELELSPQSIPGSVGRWKSQLHLGPDGTMGKWSPKTEAQDARLKAIPYVHTTPQGETMSVYSAGMQVSGADDSPVILRSGSQIQVRGRLTSAEVVTFGVTVRHPDGGFGGNFFSYMPAVAFADGKDFEVRFDINALTLDPSLADMKDELAASPIDVVVESFWCATLDPAGLEIIEVEMFEPGSTAP
jgi:hypothetical protein